MTRISKDAYYLEMAAAGAQRSTCLRRQYCAIIVKNDEIIATGYNGAARGQENCCDAGVCWREENHIPHGKQYEDCVAVHAEQNAIISAARKDMIGSTLYLVGFENGVRLRAEQVQPCKICGRMIANAGIIKVVSGDGVYIHEHFVGGVNTAPEFMKKRVIPVEKSCLSCNRSDGGAPRIADISNMPCLGCRGYSEWTPKEIKSTECNGCEFNGDECSTGIDYCQGYTPRRT